MSPNTRDIHSADPVNADPVHTITEVEKGHTEHLEDNNSLKGGRDLQDVDYNDQEDGRPRTGFRKLLTRNPSYEFIREVAQKDKEELNPVQVRSVSTPNLDSETRNLKSKTAEIIFSPLFHVFLRPLLISS